MSLLTDISTNRNNVDFIGLGAFLISSDFNREIIVINMMPMEGAHTVETISLCIERLVN